MRESWLEPILPELEPSETKLKIYSLDVEFLSIAQRHILVGTHREVSPCYGLELNKS